MWICWLFSLALVPQYAAAKDQAGKLTLGYLPPVMSKLKGLKGVFNEEQINAMLSESLPDANTEIDFESFIRVSMRCC